AGRRGVPALPAGRHALLRTERRAAPGVRPAARAVHTLGRRRVARAHRGRPGGTCSCRRVADAGALEPRHSTASHTARIGSAAAVLLLTLPGTPFLYAGEELGLEDAVVPPARRLDPGGRDGCRAPIPWDASQRHGWAGEPWLPWPPEAERRAVAVLRTDPRSILHLYRRLLPPPPSSPALRAGARVAPDAPGGSLSSRRG